METFESIRDMISKEIKETKNVKELINKLSFELEWILINRKAIE